MKARPSLLGALYLTVIHTLWVGVILWLSGSIKLPSFVATLPLVAFIFFFLIALPIFDVLLFIRYLVNKAKIKNTY